MKKSLLLLTLVLVAFGLAGCGQTPMTDADLAEQYGMSLEEFQEQKEAAARMNMNIEDHLNMGDGDHQSMDHSAMEQHKMPDGTTMADDDMSSHQEAAEAMGMTLQEHIDAGHTGH